MLCDSNFWLALSIPQHQFHDAVHEWFQSDPDSKSLIFCRSTQNSFLRILTNAAFSARFGDPPLTNQQAWSVYDALLADSRVAFQAQEPVRLELHWRRFTDRQTASPNLWMEAYLAAFAVAGGIQFVTFDAGFRQFDGLDLVLLTS
jgi:toxin-antitoxin system PIN domain toxin